MSDFHWWLVFIFTVAIALVTPTVRISKAGGRWRYDVWPIGFVVLAGLWLLTWEVLL